MTVKEIIASFPEKKQFTEIQYFEFQSCKRRNLYITRQIIKKKPPPAKILVLEPDQDYLGMILQALNFQVDQKILKGRYLSMVDKDVRDLKALNLYYRKRLGEISENKYDIVILLNLLEYLPKDPLVIFQRIKSFIRSGGYLIVVTTNGGRLGSKIKAVLSRRNYEGYGTAINKKSTGQQPVAMRQYDLNELRELVTNTGFIINREEFIIGYPPVDPLQGITLTRYALKHLYYLAKMFISPFRDTIYLEAKKS
jgi:hypothetical protein